LQNSATAREGRACTGREAITVTEPPDELPLVGRARDLQLLQEKIAALDDGVGTVTLVVGEAGSGKTRLLAEVERRVREMRGRVCAHAVAYDHAQAPYAPIRDHLLALDRALPKVLAREQDLRARLQPVFELADPSADGDEPSAARRRLLDTIIEALARFSAVRPLVLILDDAQWSDKATLDALLHLAAHRSQIRAAVIVAERGDPEGTDETERRLRRYGAERLVLGPLAEPEAFALLDLVAAISLPYDRKRELCALAEGNPLVLIALAEHLRRDPAALERRLPASLVELVRERLGGLDPQQSRVLRVAAALGRFDESLLEAVSGVSRSQIRDALRAAYERGLLVEAADGPVRHLFRHALVQRAITSELLPDERIEVHRAIVRELEARGTDDPALLAWHSDLAGDRERARRYDEEAGDRAFARLAFADAVAAYRRALDEVELDTATLALHKKFVRACDEAGYTTEAIAMLERVVPWCEREGLLDDAITAAIDRSRMRFVALDDDGALEDAQAALRMARANGDAALRFDAAAITAWYLAHRRRVEEASAVLEEARAVESAGRPRSLAWYYEARAAAEIHAGRRAEWKSFCEKMLAAAAQVSETFLVRRLTSAAALALASRVEDMSYAREMLERALRVVDRLGDAGMGYTLALAAMVAYLLGDLQNARTLVDRALRRRDEDIGVATLAARVGIPLGLHVGDELLVRRCKRDNLLVRVYDRVDSATLAGIVHAFALAIWKSGRREEARALVERTVERLSTTGNNYDLLVLAAEIQVAPATRSRARAFLKPLAGESLSAKASLALFDAYVAKGERRRALAREAAAAFEELGWKLHRARALEVAGDSEDALEIYRACGAVADVRRLERTSGVTGPLAGLSPREREIAVLIAEGLSNRAIAERLFLAERTVEHHVAAVFTKLGVRSRIEVAAAVLREDDGESAN
jgi:DNA-binding CsgD family transcriptional regulator/tetratricopeptide (TPR) repeat protein